MKIFLTFVFLLTTAVSVNADSAAGKAGFNPHVVPDIYLLDYPKYAKSGTGQVYGTLAATTKNFGKVVYKNSAVFLIPATAFTEWYLRNMAYHLENPDDPIDLMKTYPNDLVDYTRKTYSDDKGYFKFDGLPDGKYYVNTFLKYEQDAHPIRHDSQLAMSADGNLMDVPVIRTGLKITSDDVVIVSSAYINGTQGRFDEITAFDTLGEYTCCKTQF